VSASFHVVISAEANSYMAWQAKLAHYSCLTRLGQAPLIVVHEGNGEALKDFTEIDRVGGHAVPAPSYRVTARGRNYAPRNTAGTLLEAARVVGPEVEYLVLCDADVVFVGTLALRGSLAAAACGYLDYAEAPVRAAMRRLGIAPRSLGAAHGGSLRCGIPYVIPRGSAEPLALAWLEAIDAFPRPRWEDVMYAFGLAVLMLKLRLRRLRLADTNYNADAPVRAPVVHYCYDNALWSKRRFVSSRSVQRVWRPPEGAKPGSVLAAVLGQLTAARCFYASHSADVRVSHVEEARIPRWEHLLASDRTGTSSRSASPWAEPTGARVTATAQGIRDLEGTPKQPQPLEVRSDAPADDRRNPGPHQDSPDRGPDRLCAKDRKSSGGCTFDEEGVGAGVSSSS
jgi:hypothetical protein